MLCFSYVQKRYWLEKMPSLREGIRTHFLSSKSLFHLHSR